MKSSFCYLLLVLVGTITLIEGGILSKLFHRDPDWDTLRITWGVNVAKDNVFTKMPLRIKKAEEKGYVKLPSSTSSCSGKFLGNRYYKPDNAAIIMLYDHNGFFAGIQTRFPKAAASNASSTSIYQKSPFFIEEDVNGTTMYTLTAYMVDPDIICTTGRSQADYDNQKAGSALYFQNGPNPLKDFQKVPLYENETLASHWIKGECFLSMGTHYWYNTSKDMECDELLPIFLIFNHGKLTGFGWGVQANVQTSKNFEHPDKDNLGRLFDPVPKCLKDSFNRLGGFTTLHIYLNAKPWNLVC